MATLIFPRLKRVHICACFSFLQHFDKNHDVIRRLFETQGGHFRDIWSQSQREGLSCTALFSINLSGASINNDQFIEFIKWSR